MLQSKTEAVQVQVQDNNDGRGLQFINFDSVTAQAVWGSSG